MTGLQCGCVTDFGSACTRPATQEDLLCDECRAGRDRNAVFVGHETGEHQHVNVGKVVLNAIELLPRSLRYRGDPERMTP